MVDSLNSGRKVLAKFLRFITHFQYLILILSLPEEFLSKFSYYLLWNLHVCLRLLCRQIKKKSKCYAWPLEIHRHFQQILPKKNSSNWRDRSRHSLLLICHQSSRCLPLRISLIIFHWGWGHDKILFWRFLHFALKRFAFATFQLFVLFCFCSLQSTNALAKY